MSADAFAELQAAIDNQLHVTAIGDRFFCGIIGDRPSKSAKSPTIWNPTFRELGVPAVYLAFDVRRERLSDLLAALRRNPRYLGGNVTVPHKVAVVEFLDELDDKARRIGSVNTITRTADGKLVGSNTDGKGALDAIVRPQPGALSAFLPSLDGLHVLMIGAGGAARAVAAYLAEAVGKGKLTIANRSADAPRQIARAVAKDGTRVEATGLDAVAAVAPMCDLIINCSTVGQGGLRPAPDDQVVFLEPYSPLGPVHAAGLQARTTAEETYRDLVRCSRQDIMRNNEVSLEVALMTPASVPFVDIVFSPLETTLMRHGRQTGHRVMNGKGMSVSQAAEAMFNWVCSSYLDQHKMRTPETYARILETMYRVW